MKKTFYSVVPAIFAYMLTVVGYAEGNITVGRAEAIDYVLFIGIGVFLLGMIMVLLSIFAGGKREEYEVDEYDDYDEIDEEEADEEEIGKEEADEEEADEEVDEFEETAEEEEPVVEETEEDSEPDSAEEEPEPEPENVIRITLSGVNNSEVKVMEFTESVTIGRKAINDIVIDDKAVSGKHCEVTYENGTVFITDLDSTNGTFVNDEPVVRCEIESGDTIVIGKNKYKVNISM